MAAPSRRFNQQKASEHKRTIFERMQAALGRNKPAPADAQAPAETSSGENGLTAGLGTSVPEALATKVAIRYGGNGARLYQDHTDAPLVASDPLARLVDVYLDAAANKTGIRILLWPVAALALPLVHVLATMEYWNAGRKAGLRGLIFPAKENSFNPLNHLEMDRDDLARHAKAMVELKCVPDKDPVLLSVQ